MLPLVASAADVEALVEKLGFLPFFKNNMPGYSLEDCIAPGLWFAEGVDGPWEWKGPIAQKKRCVYGKFFRGRAGFISLSWFPAFANVRRQGMDLNARYEASLTPRQDMQLYNLVREHGSLNTKAIKWMGDYGRDGKKGFDSSVTRLQMRTDLVIEDFEYAIDRKGAPYGWGIARYTAPEDWLGEAFRLPEETPDASLTRILSHLQAALPFCEPKKLERMIRG